MDFGLDELKQKAKILVMYAMPYDMLNEKQEQMKGCSVQYFFWGKDGEKLFPQVEWDTSKPLGMQRAKVSIDYTCRQKITVAPALYEGTFEMRVGGDGKAVARLIDVAFICNVDFLPRYDRDVMVPGMIPYPAEVFEEMPAEGKTGKASK